MPLQEVAQAATGQILHDQPQALAAWAIADTPVLDNEVTVEGFEDLDLPLEVPLLFWPTMLQLLHGHQGPCVVAQRVVAAQFHAAKVALAQL